MLEAKKTTVFRNHYDLVVDGTRLATWDGSLWSNGGTLELEGRRYGVKARSLGSRYRMTDEAGGVVAEAERVGRKEWTVVAQDRTYRFRRASWWSSTQELVSDGRPVGSIRRVSAWRNDAEADLPGLPLPLQVFVTAVVLTMWAQAAASG